MICGIYSRLGISKTVCLICCIFILWYISYFVIQCKQKWTLWLLLCVVLGFVMADAAVQPTFVEKNGGRMRITAEGYLTEIRKTSGGFTKLTIQADVEDREQKIRYPNQKLSVIDSTNADYTIGEGIRLRGEALDFERGTGIGYDEWLYMRAEGFDCKVFPKQIEKTGEMHDNAKIRFAKANAAVQNVLEQILPPEECAVAKAMLTGNRDDIGQITQSLYTRAGVTHILCISGLHMSMLAGMVVYILQNICKQSIRRSAIGTIGICVLFFLFSGFSPSAMRAVVMISVAALGRVIYRHHDWLNSMALAAIVLLCIQPLYLYHAGFQLSFLSVLGIYIGSMVLPKPKTWYGKLGHMAGISAFASLFGMPAAAYHFSYISTVGVWSNMIVLPLSGLLLGCTILAATGGLLFQPLGVFFAGTVYVILKLYAFVCGWLVELPYSYVPFGRLPLLMILVLYALMLLLCIQPKWKGTRGAVIFCTAVLLYGMLGNGMLWKKNTVAFLDTGQSNCAVLTTYDNHVFVVDGGGVPWQEEGKNIGQTTLLPYLASRGYAHVDGLFLPDTSEKESIAACELLTQLPVEVIYTPAPLESKRLQEIAAQKNISVKIMEEGDFLKAECFGTLTCIQPDTLTLRYEYGGNSILFCGKRKGMQELELVHQGAALRSDVLQVAEHGADTASMQKFLDAVAADTAVISCGKQIYERPAESTLKKLEQMKTTYFRTDTDGNIFYTLLPNGYEIQTSKERIPVYERIEEAMEGK